MNNLLTNQNLILFAVAIAAFIVLRSRAGANTLASLNPFSGFASGLDRLGRKEFEKDLAARIGKANARERRQKFISALNEAEREERPSLDPVPKG